jgi:hypothetical protein
MKTMLKKYGGERRKRKKDPTDDEELNKEEANKKKGKESMPSADTVVKNEMDGEIDLWEIIDRGNARSMFGSYGPFRQTMMSELEEQKEEELECEKGRGIKEDGVVEIFDVKREMPLFADYGEEMMFEDRKKIVQERKEEMKRIDRIILERRKNGNIPVDEKMESDIRSIFSPFFSFPLERLLELYRKCVVVTCFFFLFMCLFLDRNLI